MGSLAAFALDSPKAEARTSRASSFDLADEAIGEPAGADADGGHGHLPLAESEARMPLTEDDAKETQAREYSPVRKMVCMVEPDDEGVDRSKPKMSVGSAWACIE